MPNLPRRDDASDSAVHPMRGFDLIMPMAMTMPLGSRGSVSPHTAIAGRQGRPRAYLWMWSMSVRKLRSMRSPGHTRCLYIYTFQ